MGKAVDVSIVRKGKELTRAVTLGRLEDNDKQASLNQPQAETPSIARQALGLSLSGLTEEMRKRYNVKDTVKGVLVTRVDPNSPAADKRIQAGDVIVEVGQEPSIAGGRDHRIDALKKDGRKSALLLIANAQGEVRFIAVPLDKEG